MKKKMAKKLIIIGLVGVRRICEERGLDFMRLVSLSIKGSNSQMTMDEVEKFVDEFEEEE